MLENNVRHGNGDLAAENVHKFPGILEIGTLSGILSGISAPLTTIAFSAMPCLDQSCERHPLWPKKH